MGRQGASMGKRLTQIATRTGDDGTTGLGDNTRVSKDHLRVHAMGDVDELNSHLGLLLCEELPAQVRELQEFILPAGNRAAAQAHVCRTVARRAERAVVALGAHDPLRETPRQYLNRLSDLMFVLARVLNRMNGGDDVYWKSERLARSADE